MSDLLNQVFAAAASEAPAKCCPRCRSEYLVERRGIDPDTGYEDAYLHCTVCLHGFDEEDAGPDKHELLRREHEAALARVGPRDESEYFSDNEVGF